MFIGAAACLWHLLVNLFAIFVFVVWFWLLISVFSDLFRRRDIGGFAKALWVIVLLLGGPVWLVVAAGIGLL